jgi:hypothetical protein
MDGMSNRRKSNPYYEGADALNPDGCMDDERRFWERHFTRTSSD